MVTRSHKKHIQKELDRLEKTGEEFLVKDVAYRLNSTSNVIAAALRFRDNVICIERPGGRASGCNYVRYKFVRKEGECSV